MEGTTPPPKPPTTPTPPGAPPPGAMPPGATPPPPPKSNMPLISLILSIAGIFCCGVLSIVGLILGYIELGKINRGESPEEGRGLAKAAVIIGIIVLALWVLSIIISAIFGGFSFYVGT